MHTPSPWHVHSEPHIFAFSITDGESRAGSMLIADVAHTRTPGVAEANARLIAAAPDLLDALQDLLEWRDEARLAVPLHILDAARSAVSKAIGR